jgi:hypothetical protein
LTIMPTRIALPPAQHSSMCGKNMGSNRDNWQQS